MDCVAFDGRLVKLARRCMHVQGISHWAPANIGPYSQSIMVLCYSQNICIKQKDV